MILALLLAAGSSFSNPSAVNGHGQIAHFPLSSHPGNTLGIEGASTDTAPGIVLSTDVPLQNNNIMQVYNGLPDAGLLIFDFDQYGGFDLDGGIIWQTMVGFQDGGSFAWWLNGLQLYSNWFPDAGGGPEGPSFTMGLINSSGNVVTRDGGDILEIWNGEPYGSFYCEYGGSTCGPEVFAVDYQGNVTTPNSGYYAITNPPNSGLGLAFSHYQYDGGFSMLNGDLILHNGLANVLLFSTNETSYPFDGGGFTGFEIHQPNASTQLQIGMVNADSSGYTPVVGFDPTGNAGTYGLTLGTGFGAVGAGFDAGTGYDFAGAYCLPSGYCMTSAPPAAPNACPDGGNCQYLVETDGTLNVLGDAGVTGNYYSNSGSVTLSNGNLTLGAGEVNAPYIVSSTQVQGGTFDSYPNANGLNIQNDNTSTAVSTCVGSYSGFTGTQDVLDFRNGQCGSLAYPSTGFGPLIISITPHGDLWLDAGEVTAKLIDAGVVNATTGIFSILDVEQPNNTGAAQAIINLNAADGTLSQMGQIIETDAGTMEFITGGNSPTGSNGFVLNNQNENSSTNTRWEQMGVTIGTLDSVGDIALGGGGSFDGGVSIGPGNTGPYSLFWVNAPSGIASNLNILDLRKNGTEEFAVDRNGNLELNGNITSGYSQAILGPGFIDAGIVQAAVYCFEDGGCISTPPTSGTYGFDGGVVSTMHIEAGAVPATAGHASFGTAFSTPPACQCSSQSGTSDVLLSCTGTTTTVTGTFATGTPAFTYACFAPL
jgi:hypothetical protein